MAECRQEIYDTALALSGNADEAKRLTNKILETPNQAAGDVLKVHSGAGSAGSGTDLTQNVCLSAEVARIAAERITWAMKR